MRPDLARAALMAYRCLARANVHELPVQPLQLLKMCHDTVVMSVDQAAEALNMAQSELTQRCSEADAWTYRVPKADGGVGWAVVFHAGGHPGRRRFTLAHELGHIVLNHDGEAPWQEREADTFASHLLCPQPVLDAWRRSGALYVEDLAASFYVSVACAEQLGLRPRVILPEELAEQLSRQFADATPDVRPYRRKR